MVDSVSRVADLVGKAAGPVTVVAVDGHSAAGKSTFAGELASRVDAALVRGDDFYRVMDPRQRAALTPAQGADQYYDWQRLREDVLTPLKRGELARFHPYDWSTNCLSQSVTTVAASAVIVVEGLFVSRPELADLVDVSVFVTTDPQERTLRQQQRADASPEWLARWDAAERWYFDVVRRPATFDVTIEGVA